MLAFQHFLVVEQVRQEWVSERGADGGGGGFSIDRLVVFGFIA